MNFYQSEFCINYTHKKTLRRNKKKVSNEKELKYRMKAK